MGVVNKKMLHATEFPGTYANMTAQTTTTILAKKGFLHAITVNKPVASGTISLFDNASAGSGTSVGIITTPATATNPFTVFYDVELTNGLTITTAGATQDITISFR